MKLNLRRVAGVVLAGLLLLLVIAIPLPAQTPPTTAQIQKKVEEYIRKLYAWGPDFEVTAGTPKEAPAPGFYEVEVRVAYAGQADSTSVLISKDGNYLVRGEIFDTNKDPYAEIRSKINLEGAPTKGPMNARVVVVEYADFQCPTCRRFHETARELQPEYPNVRWVFKNLPLAQIHPWAETAALAGACVQMQDPKAFWRFHDLAFDNQQIIRADDAFQKVLEYAGQAGVNQDAVRICMSSEEAKKRIEADVAEAQELRIANTPTIFVNGRRIVGGEATLVRQFLDYELAAAGQATKGAPKK